jgi:hypothetical protein
MFNKIKSTELLATKQYSTVITSVQSITARSIDKPSKGPQQTTCLTNTVTVKHSSAPCPQISEHESSQCHSSEQYIC